MPDYDNPELFDTIRRQLDSGSTFGELALLQSNSMTSATIITNTKCEFACMDRSAFWKYSGKQKQQELDEKLEALKRIPFLRGWIDSELKTISFHFESRKRYRKERIFEEGQVNIGMYLILKGEVQLQRSQIIEKQSKEVPLIQFNKQITHDISVVSNNEIIGDDASTHYQYTATCLSTEVDLFFISKQDLDRRLSWNENSKNIYQNLMKAKSLWRVERQKQYNNMFRIKQSNTNEQDIKQYIREGWIESNQSSYLKTNFHSTKVSPKSKISNKQELVKELDFLNPNILLDQNRLPSQINKRQNKMIILKDQIKVLGGTNFKNFKDQKRYEKKMREQFEKSISKLKMKTEGSSNKKSQKLMKKCETNNNADQYQNYYIFEQKQKQKNKNINLYKYKCKSQSSLTQTQLTQDMSQCQTRESSGWSKIMVITKLS